MAIWESVREIDRCAAGMHNTRDPKLTLQWTFPPHVTVYVWCSGSVVVENGGTLRDVALDPTVIFLAFCFVSLFVNHFFASKKASGPCLYMEFSN